MQAPLPGPDIHDTGSELETRALACYLDGDYSATVDAYERAHSVFRRDGDALAAARAARMLSWIHGNIRGDWAVGQGWVRRALTALDGSAPDTREHGWTVLMQAWDEPDPTRQSTAFATALTIARLTGDRDLEYEALGWVGLRQVFDGQVEQGLGLLDETLAAVCAGEVEDLVVIESTFCGMLWACETVQDVRRAEQWVRASEQVCRRRNLPAMTSFCRAHYGAILTVAGRWAEADEELTLAAALAVPIGPRIHANALSRLADLRLRQGRLEEAAQLLKGLDRYAEAVRPLAALHHARGELARARAVLDRGLGPGLDASTDAALLVLLVQVALAQDDRATAESAAGRLDRLGAAPAEPGLRGYACLARGLLSEAGGGPDAASALDRAVTAFATAGMPWELAAARLELARALADDRPDLAVEEARAALETAYDLGASRLADAGARLLRSLGVRVPSGPPTGRVLTRREAEVLGLLGHGLSNPEISDRLYISRKTVEHHVSSILAKLQLRSRAEAAGYAARNMRHAMGEFPDPGGGPDGRT